MRERLLNRFLKYVKIYTPSDADSSASPSSECQLDLAHALEEEMKALGISGVYIDENGYVYGYLPATAGLEDAPKVGFLAHMDTVSDFCTKPVTPLVHENYDGEDIFLPAGNRTISVKDYPHLSERKGRTVITSDGTTILGADDKAGIAEIMTMADELIKSNVSHGRISIAFTPDEEIGSGAEKLDLTRFGADFAYTADGDLEGGLEFETFNAASAIVEIHGVNVHPGSAKDIMINSASVACEFQGLLPESEQPRSTSGYEGFYHLIELSGNVEKTTMKYIIRDHDRDLFEKRKRTFDTLSDSLNKKYGSGTVSVKVTDSYYNMKEILKDHMELIDYAKQAIKEAGLEPRIKPVRGGTDGARLSFRGLPCPNLGTGGAAFHGPYEHITLEGMETAVRILLNLVKITSGQKPDAK
ncbi:MAG: peptidase T [Parasporobacterium sp.]|nr:peptidase T [Parasporobacterium sp.]MBR3643862.1 peptidase T [Parasporobacterium sp.]